MKKSYWFCLDPYVHVSVHKKIILIYNSLNGKLIEHKNQPVIKNIIERLLLEENLLVIKISETDLENPELKYFINKLKKNLICDLVETTYSQKKPVQFPPILKIHKSIHNLKNSNLGSVGENIMDYLNKISLYITNKSKANNIMYKDAYKQFICNYIDPKEKSNLDLTSIKKLVLETKQCSNFLLNILGGDISEFPEIKELILFLNKIDIPKYYAFDYRSDNNHKTILRLIRKENSHIKLFIDFPMNCFKFSRFLDIIRLLKLDYEINFIIKYQKEINLAEEIISENNLKNCQYHPYYNGNNLTLFKKKVFIKKKNIIESTSSLNDILIRKVINPLNFGKISILSNGDIYANLNSEKLGVLDKNSIYKSITKELISNNDWRRTRSMVEPCKQCPYNLLCPPLTNYEYILQRNNLCNIWDEINREENI